jgi:internalin A
VSELKRLEIERGLPDDFSIPSSVRHIQFGERLPEDDLEKLRSALHYRPEVAVRAYFGHVSLRSKRILEPFTDLEFLRFFPDVRALAIDLWSLEDISGLRHVRALDSFSFGQTKTKRLSLRFLEDFPMLCELHIERHTKDIDVIAGLRQLEELSFRCVTLPSLDLIGRLDKLQRVNISLGGTHNLDALANLPHLRDLELTLIKKLDDLAVIGKLESLEKLTLRFFRNVVRLPSLRHLTRLRRVLLEALSVTDLHSVADAAALESLVLCDLPKLDVRTLRCFLGHPTLRDFTAGLGSFKKDAYAEALLNLARSPYLPAAERTKASVNIAIEDAKRMMN